jgi:hypothetical protein
MAQVYQGSVSSSTYEGRGIRLNWSVDSTSIEGNYKVLYWTLTGFGGSGYHIAGNFKVVIDGETVFNSATRIELWNGTVVASGRKTVYHDNWGNKTFTASIEAGIYWTAVNCSGSGTWELQTIPRYLTITKFDITNVGETSAICEWATSDPRNSTYYSLDGGATWIGSATYGEYLASDGKSGSFNIYGLNANTNYNIKIKIKRSDSGLWTETDNKPFTTYNFPHCTSTPSFKIGDWLTLSFYNPLQRYIQIYLILADGTVFGGDAITSTTLGGYQGAGWQNILYSSIPNSQSGTYRVRVVYGDVTMDSAISGTYSIRGTEVPTLSDELYYEDTGSSTVAVTGNKQHIVQGKSVVRVGFGSATANYGAGGITKYIVECGGNTYDLGTYRLYTFGFIRSSTDTDLKLTAIDSRGLSASKTIRVTMLEYSTPNAIVDLRRLNNYEDETYLTIDGSVSSLNGNNTMEIKYRYKEQGGNYGDYVWVNDRETRTLSLDKNKVYIFQVSVIDVLGTTFTKTYTLDKGKFPLFIDTEKNSVGVNCFPKNENSLEVNGLDVSTIKEFAKKFKLTANTWTDVGIRYDDLETGTYIMQVEMNDANPQNAQYGEKISGILTWYGLPTNGADADIIPVSKSGHSRNGHDIQLRTLRTLSSDAGVLKLQIMDTANWNMESNVVFRFKRLI